MEIERDIASLKMLLAGLEVELARLTGIERVAVEQRTREVRDRVAELERRADEAATLAQAQAVIDMADAPLPLNDVVREQIAGLRRDVTRLQAQVDVLLTDVATMKADLRYVAQELSERKGSGIDSRLGLILLIISTVTVFAALFYLSVAR